MPIREYQAQDLKHACPKCQTVFERLERLAQPPLKHCPECGTPLRRLISRLSHGASRSNFDDRAKSAGFHKLKKLSRGEYEKLY